MNKAFMDCIGRDAVGERCYRVLCGLDAPCPWCRRQEVFAGETARMEFENPADGRWYDAVMSPIVDDSGSVRSIELFAIDITERKQAESALAERPAYLREENVRLKSSMRDRFRFGDIIGKSKPMQTVYDLILNAAATYPSFAKTSHVLSPGSPVPSAIIISARLQARMYVITARQQAAAVVTGCGAAVTRFGLSRIRRSAARALAAPAAASTSGTDVS